MNNKRGQVTIFIIVAILIIVIGALIYMLSPGLRSAIGQDPNNPYEFIKTCLEEDVENNIALVSSQGGSMDPEHYYLYADTNIEYLCYTNEAYETCIIQQPMLKQHVEKEIKSSLESLVDQCFYSMEESFDKKILRKYIGGRGLGIRILYDELRKDLRNFNRIFNFPEIPL